MDAFQGYVFEQSAQEGEVGGGHEGEGGGGQWWEIQSATRCCINCRPTCGNACCTDDFACVSAGEISQKFLIFDNF